MLEKIKRRLGITGYLQDDLLEDLIEDATYQFEAITGASEIQPKYHFIIVDVVCTRYNRKGSEGMLSESVDGYSVTYDTDDFKKYQWLLDRDFGNNGLREKGSVKFI